jgi:hypothetical protein
VLSDRRVGRRRVERGQEVMTLIHSAERKQDRSARRVGLERKLPHSLRPRVTCFHSDYSGLLPVSPPGRRACSPSFMIGQTSKPTTSAASPLREPVQSSPPADTSEKRWTHFPTSSHTKHKFLDTLVEVSSWTNDVWPSLGHPGGVIHANDDGDLWR